MSLIDDAIKALRAKSIAEPHTVPPPTAEQIAAAEATLRIKFPPSFLAFLRECGAYQMPFWETYWVGDDALGSRNIVEANRSEHEDAALPLPDFLVSFFNNGAGDQLCFDTRHLGTDGEYPVVFWDHERSADENLKELWVVSDSFAEWLQEEVNRD